jgi:hypothetical protein
LQRPHFPEPANPVTIGGGPDLALDLLRMAEHLRCLADFYQSDVLRDALISLSSECNATAAIILRYRDALAKQAHGLGPARKAPAVA